MAAGEAEFLKLPLRKYQSPRNNPRAIGTGLSEPWGEFRERSRSSGKRQPLRSAAAGTHE